MIRILLLGILLCSLRASAATFYVSAATGSDSANGSSATPWLTVQKAANTVVAGDTVMVRAGTYPEEVHETTAGSSGSPITYTADDTDGTVTVAGFYLRAPYLVINGPFTLAGTGVPGSQPRVYLNALADNCVVSGLTITGTPGTTTQTSGAVGMTFAPSPDNCTFEDLTITDMNNTWITVGGSGHIIQNCTMSGGNGWDAIRLLGSNMIARGNTIMVSRTVAFDIDDPHPDSFQMFVLSVPSPENYPIQNNLIEGNTCIGDGTVDLVQIGNLEDQGGLGIVADITIRNNVFARIDRTLNVYPSGVKFYNNTFYRAAVNSGAAISNGDPAIGRGLVENLDIRNNLFVECGFADTTTNGWYAVNKAGTGLITDYNLVVGTGAGTTKSTFSEAHGINGQDPLFVDAANNDFRLQPGSPAIGAGVDLSDTFTTDFAGNTRTTWDIGAYAYAPDDPGDLPTAPSSLAATATSSSSIGLTWTDNSSNETGFELDRSPDGSTGWTQIATPAANATSASSTGLTALTSYYYRIRAVNAAGKSPYTSVASAMTNDALSPAARTPLGSRHPRGGHKR